MTPLRFDLFLPGFLLSRKLSTLQLYQLRHGLGLGDHWQSTRQVEACHEHISRLMMKCLSVLATVDIIYPCFESTANTSRRRTFRWTMTREILLIVFPADHHRASGMIMMAYTTSTVVLSKAGSWR